MGKDIIEMKTIGARREVCKNCGFTDIYGLTSNTPVMVLVLGLLVLGLFSVFIVLN